MSVKLEDSGNTFTVYLQQHLLPFFHYNSHFHCSVVSCGTVYEVRKSPLAQFIEEQLIYWLSILNPIFAGAISH